MLEIMTAIMCSLWLVVSLMTKRSISVGAFVLARCQVEWGPFLEECKIPTSRTILNIITKKVAPRYSAWMSESAGFLNTLFITGFTTAAVGILTLFDINNNAAVYPYSLLIIIMIGANLLSLFGAYIVFHRLQKMMIAHDLLFNMVSTLNILQGDDVPDEARDAAETILSTSTSVEQWETLTQDKIDIDTED
jgi:hypothetical protein